MSGSPRTALSSPENLDLRVMTYNIKGAEYCSRRRPGPKRDFLALGEIAQLIENQSPDLVALQEIAIIGNCEEVADQVRYLARRLGMNAAFGPVEGLARMREGKVHGCDFWGNAVLSRFQIADYTVHELRRGDPPEPRSILETRIDLGEGEMTFISTHLSYVWPITFAQAQDLAALVAAIEGPVVVAGDFNATAGSPELSPIQALLRDAFTLCGVPFGDRSRFSFPEGSASDRDLDHIFVSADVQVRACRVEIDRGSASDHNPLLVDLSVPVPALRRAVAPKGTSESVAH